MCPLRRAAVALCDLARILHGALAEAIDRPSRRRVVVEPAGRLDRLAVGRSLVVFYPDREPLLAHEPERQCIDCARPIGAKFCIAWRTVGRPAGMKICPACGELHRNLGAAGRVN